MVSKVTGLIVNDVHIEGVLAVDVVFHRIKLQIEQNIAAQIVGISLVDAVAGGVGISRLLGGGVTGDLITQSVVAGLDDRVAAAAGGAHDERVVIEHKLQAERVKNRSFIGKFHGDGHFHRLTHLGNGGVAHGNDDGGIFLVLHLKGAHRSGHEGEDHGQRQKKCQTFFQ